MRVALFAEGEMCLAGVCADGRVCSDRGFYKMGFCDGRRVVCPRRLQAAMHAMWRGIHAGSGSGSATTCTATCHMHMPRHALPAHARAAASAAARLLAA
jgi:hypothetical protein